VAEKITAEVVKGLAAHETVFDNEVRGFLVRRHGGEPHYGVKARMKWRQVGPRQLGTGVSQVAEARYRSVRRGV